MGGRWMNMDDMDTYSSMEEIARIIERLAKRTSLSRSTRFSFNSDNELNEEEEEEEEEYDEERGGYEEDEGGGCEEEEEGEEDEGEYLLEEEDDEQTRDILNGIGYKYKYSSDTEDCYSDGYLMDDEYDYENDSDEVFDPVKSPEDPDNIDPDPDHIDPDPDNIDPDPDIDLDPDNFDPDPDSDQLDHYEQQTSAEFSSYSFDDLDDIIEEDETELSDYDNLHDDFSSGASTFDLCPEAKVKVNERFGDIVAEMLSDTSDPFVQKMLERFLVRSNKSSKNI